MKARDYTIGVPTDVLRSAGQTIDNRDLGAKAETARRCLDSVEVIRLFYAWHTHSHIRPETRRLEPVEPAPRELDAKG
jgi:hypothetical protein